MYSYLTLKSSEITLVEFIYITNSVQNSFGRWFWTVLDESKYMGLSSNEFLLERIRKKVPFFFHYFICFFVIYLFAHLLPFLFPLCHFSRNSMGFAVVPLISQGSGVVYYMVFH